MAELGRAAGPEISISGSNPFPGLRPYNPDEHHLYFGRAEQASQLMARLRSARFLSVVGTSGSGKSSLVLAGLVPGLHSGFMASAGSSWRVAVMRPGGDPIGNLAEALASPKVIGEKGDDQEIARSLIEAALRGSSLGLAQSVEVAAIPKRDNVLLVVDQFEELFRFKQRTRSGAGREAAMAFVKLLLAAVEQPVRLYVVITMRSDFIGDCMEFPGLPEAINEGQYLVPRMTRAELRQAITGPVGVEAGRISPRLVSRLLNEVGDEIDQLPVMQHALMRMWGTWENAGREGAIDLEHYQAIGTMKNALSIHAEKAYQELQEGRQREIAERVFKTLTEMEGEGRGIRRPARLSELCELAEATEEEVAAVIAHFRLPGRCFLMPPISKRLSPETIVDISHESLMRNWVRLRTWTEEEASSARIYRRLSEAAHHHEAGEAGLWRSPELDLGLSWRDQHRPTPAWARRYDPDFDRAMRFLDKSKEVRDDYQAQRELAERRRRRRKGWAAASFGFVLLIMGFLWYVWQEARFLGAVSKVLTVNDPLLKAQVLGGMPEPLLRRIGWLLRENEPSPGGLELDALRAAASELIPEASLVADQPLTDVAVSYDGAWVVTLTNGGGARLWPADGRADPILLEGVHDVSFHPQRSRELALASRDGTVQVWEVERGKRPEEWRVQRLQHGNQAASASFSADGRRLVTVAGASVRVWERAPGGDWTRVAERALGDGKELDAATPNDDGTRILAFSKLDRTARLWSPEDDTVRSLEGHSKPITAAAFDPGSGWAVTASLDGTARLWRLDGPPDSTVLGTPGKLLFDVAVSPDGRQVAAAGLDTRVRLWDVGEIERARAAAQPVPGPALLTGHQEAVTRVLFTPDNLSLVTTSRDHTTRLWSRAGEPEGVLLGHRHWVQAAAVSGDPARGLVLATAGEDGTALVWPLEPGEPWRFPRHGDRVSRMALETERAGELLVLATSSGREARVLRLRSSSGRIDEGSRPRKLRHGGRVNGLSLHPDGSTLATAAEDGRVRIWTAGAAEAEVLSGHRGGVTSVAFSPNGSRLVSSGKDKTVRLWEHDATGWSSVEIGSFDAPVLSASFSPDGGRIVTTSGRERREVRIWSLNGDETARLEDPGAEDPARGAVIQSAAFGPDGQIVTVSADDTAKVWSKEGSGWRAVRLVGHANDVNSAAFSAGGRTVVTASDDRTARVWRAEDGKELYRLTAGVPVEAAAFSREGAYVVTGHADGTVLRWRVTEEGLHDYLRHASSACLTVEQRCLLLGEFEWLAKRRYSACEEANQRTPPAELGSCD